MGAHPSPSRKAGFPMSQREQSALRVSSHVPAAQGTLRVAISQVEDRPAALDLVGVRGSGEPGGAGWAARTQGDTSRGSAGTCSQDRVGVQPPTGLQDFSHGPCWAHSRSSTNASSRETRTHPVSLAHLLQAAGRVSMEMTCCSPWMAVSAGGPAAEQARRSRARGGGSREGQVPCLVPGHPTL